MSSGSKIPIEKAMPIARRFLTLIKPHVLKSEIAGSVRRECKMVGDIEIVCVENPLNALDNTIHKNFPGLVVNGSRLKRFKYPKENIQIELYITSSHDYGRILAIRTGSASFSHNKLAIAWNRLGWCGTTDGLRRKSECNRKSRWIMKPEFKDKPTLPPVFNTEYDFFSFLGIPWTPPKDRDWTSTNIDY